MKRPGLPILIAITALNPLSINILQPVIPGIAAAFATDYATAQLTFTAYIFAFAAAQLVHGPLSDQLGRRPVVISGFVVFLGGTALCLAATSIQMLVAGRVMQAIGGCAGFVLARAIVRDMHGREKAAAYIGYMTSVMVLAPMMAPSLGGLMAELGGWQGVFVLLGGAGLAAFLASCLWLHETRPAAPEGGRPPMLTAIRILLREPLFICYAGGTACTSAIFFSFIGGTPYVVVELQGQPPTTYGLLFAIMAIGYMIGNFTVGRFSERLGLTRLMFFGSASSLGGVVLTGICYSLFPASPLALFAPMILLNIGNGLVLPGATAGAVSVKPELAGTAAGLAGALQFTVSATAATIVGILLSDSAWPMLAVMMCVATLALLFLIAAERLSRSAAD